MTAPEPGIYRWIPYSEYAAWGYARKSMLWTLLNRSPAHYKTKCEAAISDSPALAFGRAFHSWLLERETFEKYYIIGGPINPKTGKPYGTGTKTWTEYVAENPGKEIVSIEDMLTIRHAAEALLHHEDIAPILQDTRGVAEESMAWEDPETGIMCQGRIDWHIPGCLFLDVKTTRNAHPVVFGKDAAKYGYFMQAAFYHDGLKILTGASMPAYFLAVEKEEPFAASVHEVDPDEMEYGRGQYRRALIRLFGAQEDGVWMAYPGVHKLTPPAWARADTIFD